MAFHRYIGPLYAVNSLFSAVLPTFSGVKSRTPYFCTKKFTFRGSGGYPPQENLVILTSELSNFRHLLMIFFEITEVSYILG